jgi:hypothetical protein
MAPKKLATEEFPGSIFSTISWTHWPLFHGRLPGADRTVHRPSLTDRTSRYSSARWIYSI